MEAYYKDDAVQLHLGEALDVLPTLPDASVDAVVCDPPYALTELPTTLVAEALTAWLTGDRAYVPASGAGFMGMGWDRFVPPPAIWDECLRVLKPGGHLLAFAGARTVDLMGLSIRLSGLQIRDSIDWIYGSGMPKGKHQLKPAHEPIIMARRPLNGSLTATIDSHGTGALNIDRCRVGTNQVRPKDGVRKAHDEFGTFAEAGGGARSTGSGAVHDAGRWPTNVVLSHPPILDDHGQPIGDACTDGCVDGGCPVAEMDAQSGITPSNARRSKGSVPGTGYSDGWTGRSQQCHADSGGASRFFPVFRYEAKAPKTERPRLADGTAWPTVKPLTLMRWLVRLATPPGGTVLDWCTGTGTTLEAARLEGLDAIGVERERTAADLSVVRLNKPYMTDLFGGAA